VIEHLQEVEVYDPPPVDDGDYVLQFKIKNGPLLRALRMRGVKSLKPFCDKVGVCYTTVCRYLALRAIPLTKKGKWKDSALKLAHVLQLPPDSLFPEQHMSHALKRTSGELTFSTDDIRELFAPSASLDPESALIEGQASRKLHDLILRKLSPREQRLLSLRYGLDGGEEHTLDEVGAKFGVSKERIRQMEIKALAKLAKPTVQKELAEFTDQPHGRWRSDAEPHHYVPPDWDFSKEKDEEKERRKQEELQRIAAEVSRDVVSKAALTASQYQLHRQQDALVWTEAPPSPREAMKDKLCRLICKTHPQHLSWNQLMAALGVDQPVVQELAEELVDEGRLNWRRL